MYRSSLTASTNFLLKEPDSKLVYFLMQSEDNSASSFLSSPNWSFPRESIQVYANYLRSYFSMSQPNNLPNRARANLSELCRASCTQESPSPFCFLIPRMKFSRLQPNYPLPPVQMRVDYLMPKHLPRSGINFLFDSFNFSWFLQTFFSIWKSFFTVAIFKTGKPFNFCDFFDLTFCIFCVSNERIILQSLLFFVGPLIFFFPSGRFLPCRVHCRLNSSFSIHFESVKQAQEEL